MTIDEPGIVFHVIAEAGDSVNIAQTFLEHLEHVFAHVKREIVEFCVALELKTLEQIRKILFGKLLKVFPLDNYDLSERRKASCLAEDVYLLGFSLVSKRQHTRLKKILKKNPKDTTSVEKSCASDDANNLAEIKPTDKVDSGELLAACLSLQKTVKDLNIQVKELTQRVNILEGQVGVLKSAEEGPIAESETISNSTIVSCSQPSNVSLSNTRQIIAEVHRDVDGIEQMPVLNRDDKSSDSVKSDVFRHTDRDRKNILVGKRRFVKLKAAASDSKDKTQTCLVYVGKLSRETREDVIRSYLQEIGVDKDDIADILRLKTRNENESSFRISLNTREAAGTALKESNWPKGVRVRTFRHPYEKRQTSRNPVRNYYDKAPRFSSASRSSSALDHFYPVPTTRSHKCFQYHNQADILNSRCDNYRNLSRYDADRSSFSLSKGRPSYDYEHQRVFNPRYVRTSNLYKYAEPQECQTLRPGYY